MAGQLHGVRRIGPVTVPMRDGCRLAADIYIPVPSGTSPVNQSWPVLLQRTPYSRRCDDLVREASFFARRGYVVVLQDVRGRYDSDGQFDPFGPSEVTDGYDTMAWIVTQPWSNGKIGTMGSSYMAYTQAALAMSNPPGLAAQFISQGFSNHFNGRLRQGGAARLDIAFVWALQLARTSRVAREQPSLQQALDHMAANVEEWLWQLPFRPGQTVLARIPEIEAYILEVTTRGEYDDYWRQIGRNASPAWDRYPDVPICLLGSWYDSHSLSTVQAYQELRARPRKSPLFLILGPWAHGLDAPNQPWAGEVHFGMDAVLEYDTLRLAFFDKFLKGKTTDLFDGAPVRIFIMGGGDGRRIENDLDPPRMNHGGRWRYAWHWPLPETRYIPFYLQPGGRLSRATPPSSPPSQYLYDPNNPVPTIGGQVSSTYQSSLRPGPYNQVQRPEWGHPNNFPVGSRSDVLVFETEPLDEPLEVTGPITVRLFVSSSAPDTDFTAKLIDVYPPNSDYPSGFALNLTDGILRMRYRNSWTTPEWMQPGQIYEIQIELPPVSNLFAKGHRIRLDISSSNFPRFDRNFNTAEPVGQWRSRQVALNSVYHDPEHPSHVILPVVPS